MAVAESLGALERQSLDFRAHAYRQRRLGVPVNRLQEAKPDPLPIRGLAVQPFRG
jgi:hypothetical protein